MVLNQKSASPLTNEDGQAVTEYILMMAVIVSFYLIFTTALVKMGFAKKMMTLMTGNYSRVYQYGHPKAKGFENGGPEYHPMAEEGGQNNFRIFFNPRNN